jgi:glycerophosphoryl diester phosphodiesterase
MKHVAFEALFCLCILGVSGCRGPVEVTAHSSASGYRGPVEIIAHRGASYDAPENTMASLRLGWQRHADVELDVYLSKDNRMVVIHDISTKRTAGGVDLKVKESSADQLRALDVGSFKGKEFAGERIPFLAEVVQAIPPKQKLYIEIKCGKEILPALRQLLVESGKMSQIVIIGFDLETVAESKKQIDVPTYWLKGTDKDKKTEQWIPHNPKLVQTARDKGLDGLDVHFAGVTGELVQAAKAAGQKLYVWTVDDPAEARRLVRLGVDGITTNRPDWLRKHLQNQASCRHE